MNDINCMQCNVNGTIRDVMSCIDKNLKKIAFIVDDDSKMVGILSDGDIRRLLLKGYGLNEKIEAFMNKNFRFVKLGDDFDNIISKNPCDVTILPVLDNDKHVIDYFEYNSGFHVPIAQPNLNGNEYKYLMDAFLSSWISSTGKYIDLFEDRFSSYCGVKYGVATSNGTTALHLALTALGIKEGDEVIVPDLTFAATINSVIYTGATPVIVDIEVDGWCIDPKKIEEAITEKTKAIISVHLYGQPCDMGIICQIAKKYNLFIVEDCAEAHGAKWNGNKVGSFGDISCFSFFGNKVITTGEGGMCVTNNEELYAKLKVLRDHGMSKTRKYYHEMVGFNYRMTNLQAAIGAAQIERIEEILIWRKSLEDMYRKALSENSKIQMQIDNIAKRDKIAWLVSVLVPADKRDFLIDKMKEKGIDARAFFFPLSKMDIYKKYAKSKSYYSWDLSMRGINLPTSYEVSQNVVNIIRDIFKENL